MKDLQSLKQAIDTILEFDPEKDLERMLKNLLFSQANSINLYKFPEQEIWKVIPGFDQYSVSTCGRIWSSKTERYLKPDLLRNGYLQVTLRKNSKSKKISVHRVVAETFRGSDMRLDFVVNHIDGDKTNNNVNNLEWRSQSDNLKHSYALRKK
jgi:hypothetical protein